MPARISTEQNWTTGLSFFIVNLSPYFNKSPELSLFVQLLPMHPKTLGMIIK